MIVISCIVPSANFTRSHPAKQFGLEGQGPFISLNPDRPDQLIYLIRVSPERDALKLAFSHPTTNNPYITMSSVIAVAVTLIGLSGAVFTLAIFVQMLLSFPTMLSSNSRAYVQQQRKLYHISPAQDLVPDEDGPEGEDVEDSWVDDVTEENTSQLRSNVESARTTTRKPHVGIRRTEPMTRGRTLRRSRRRQSMRTVVRTQETGAIGAEVAYDHEASDLEHADMAAPLRAAGGKQECRHWKSMEWAR